MSRTLSTTIYFSRDQWELIATIEASESRMVLQLLLSVQCPMAIASRLLSTSATPTSSRIFSTSKTIFRLVVCYTLAKRLKRVGYWPEDVERARRLAVLAPHHSITSLRRGAAYCPEATVLHFRARWKSGPEHDPIAVSEAARDRAEVRPGGRRS